VKGYRQSAPFLAALALSLPVNRTAAQCAPFHDSLNDASSITANGGVVTGTVDFTPAVNETGAVFSGAGYVTYANAVFASQPGSLSMWFRKNSSDAAGGIAQIGSLGQPNSIGVFYADQTDVRFEMRNDAGDLTAVSATGVLSQTDWTHIFAIWHNRGGGHDLLLFINGFYVTAGYLAGLFNHNATWLQIGVTGYYGFAEGVMDEVRFFDWDVSDDEAYAEYVYSSLRYDRQPATKPASTGPVQIVGRDLFVAGRPFRVKGVGYQPTPIGYPIERWVLDFIYTDPQIITRDMGLLRSMNVNTIRTWSQVPDIALLDACYNGGDDPIYVIMGFWVPLHAGVDYSDPATAAAIESDFQGYVNQFKDHPAVLAWGIGNENNLAYDGDVADWYALANDLAQVAYAEEGAGYHPTVVINGGMRYSGDVDFGSDDASLDYVDVWAHNAYPGYAFRCYFDYYDLLSAKPLIFTEYGIDAYDNQSGGEYQSVQADYVVQQWRQLEAASVGGTLMAYSDEWWKAGDPNNHDLGGYATRMHPDGFSNEEWWGLVWVEDNGVGPDIMHPRLAYYALAAEYADVSGDYDLDDDTDLADFAAFQRCFGSAAAGACGQAFEFVANGVIDLDDLAMFNVCLNGPNHPPACAE
jgi:hypothetical protein